MTSKTKTLLILMTALALSACGQTDRSSGALSDITDGGTCDPSWETTLQLTEGSRDVVGRVVWTMSATEVTAELYADSGWEIGDTYLGIGHGGMAPTWTAANPEPWITGWLTYVSISMPLDAAITCGDELKLQIQANVRAAGGASHQLASAFGPQDRAEWGWADFRPLCCDVPETPDGGVGCTLTQGFWKNHPGAWPVSSLTLGGTVYDQAALMDLLNTPVRGDASLALAHQLIAAELNVAAGATPIAAIADAQAWMAANGTTLPYGIAPSSAAGADAIALNEALTDFNEGRSGPGHCDDDADEDMDEDMDEDVDEDVDED